MLGSPPVMVSLLCLFVGATSLGKTTTAGELLIIGIFCGCK